MFCLKKYKLPDSIVKGNNYYNKFFLNAVDNIVMERNVKSAFPSFKTKPRDISSLRAQFYCFCVVCFKRTIPLNLHCQSCKKDVCHFNNEVSLFSFSPGGKPDDITCIVARVTHQSEIFL